MKRFILVLLCAVAVMLPGFADAADPLLFMPFPKTQNWYCTQGPGGSYSHYQQPTLYGYDWTQGQSGSSPANIAFGAMIYSPVQGTVVRVVTWVPDFTNNASGNANNNNGWGNQVIIQEASNGRHVRMNHMQQNSAAVAVGNTVAVGTYIGRIGQSGFSTSPHLHMQVQNAAEYSNSIPFSFVEGPVHSGAWFSSLNLGNANILDNNAATNLGNIFGTTGVAVNGNWNSYTTGSGFVGGNFFTHQVISGDLASFTWTFTVKVSGSYNIMASWVPKADRDPSAKYNVFGETIYRDQRYVDAIGSDNWTTLKYGVYLNAGQTYRVVLQGTTSGRTIMADGLIVQRMF